MLEVVGVEILEEEEEDAEYRERDRGVRVSRREEEERDQAPFFYKNAPPPFLFF